MCFNLLLTCSCRLVATGDVLGKGTDGTVFKSLNMETGDVVAIKQIALRKIPSTDVPAMMREIDLMKNLDHPNIGLYVCVSTFVCAFA